MPRPHRDAREDELAAAGDDHALHVIGTSRRSSTRRDDQVRGARGDRRGEAVGVVGDASYPHDPGAETAKQRWQRRAEGVAHSAGRRCATVDDLVARHDQLDLGRCGDVDRVDTPCCGQGDQRRVHAAAGFGEQGAGGELLATSADVGTALWSRPSLLQREHPRVGRDSRGRLGSRHEEGVLLANHGGGARRNGSAGRDRAGTTPAERRARRRADANGLADHPGACTRHGPSVHRTRVGGGEIDA